MSAKFITPAPFSERMNKEEEFFSKPFLMSYSGLNRLLFSPSLFYNHYILGQKEDVNDRNMIEGKLIHCLLLNPDNFDNEFVVSVQDTPSDNPRTLLHRLHAHYDILKSEGDTREDLHEFAPAILDILADMNLYQSLKTDAQRLEKVITEKNVDYWDYIRKAKGRTVIDQPTLDFAKQVKDKITANPAVMDVMGFFGNMVNGIEHHNEIELAMFPSHLQFGIRGFLDNLVIDREKKEIRVNDLKKTSKDLNSFPESIEYYRYWLQGGIYYMLAKHYLDKPEYADYNFVFRFIVVDAYQQIAPIRVSDETMAKWVEMTNVKLEQANYHFERRQFDLPYEFLVNTEVVL